MQSFFELFITFPGNDANYAHFLNFEFYCRFGNHYPPRGHPPIRVSNFMMTTVESIYICNIADVPLRARILDHKISGKHKLCNLRATQSGTKKLNYK